MADQNFGQAFWQAFSDVHQLRMQQEAEKRAVIQQSVDNAMKAHQQQITETHYKALEEEARASEALQRRSQDRLEQQAQWNQRRDQMRLQAASIAQRFRGALSLERITADLRKWGATQGYPSDQIESLVNSVAGEFWTNTGMPAPDGEGAAPSSAMPPTGPVTLGQTGIAALPPSPKTMATIDNLHSQIKARDEMTDVRADLVKAQTHKIASDEAYTAARTKLAEMQAWAVRQNYNLHVDEFRWRKLFQGKELQIREFNSITGRIEAQLRANSNDQTALRDAQNLQRFSKEYKQRANTALTAAMTRLNNQEDALRAARQMVSDIKKLPENQQSNHAADLLKAQAVISALDTKHFDLLRADINRARKEYDDANQAEFLANQLNQKRATPTGGLTSPLGAAPVPGLPKIDVSALKASERRNTQRVRDRAAGERRPLAPKRKATYRFDPKTGQLVPIR